MPQNKNSVIRGTLKTTLNQLKTPVNPLKDYLKTIKGFELLITNLLIQHVDQTDVC